MWENVGIDRPMIYGISLTVSSGLYLCYLPVYSLREDPPSLIALTEWISKIMENVCLMSQPGGKPLRNMM